MYTRFLREDGAGGTGGGLGDLVNTLTNPQPLPDSPPEKTDAQLAEEAAATQTALKAEALEADGTLKPGYIQAADGTISKDENYKATPVPAEGLDANGNLLPGYIKDADGKISIDPAYEPAEMTEEEETAAFFERVNAITGDALEIEYPAGVSPLSPEGIAHYTNVIREDAANTFEQYLQQKDPRGYAYLVHRANGGSDEDFMKGPGGFVLPTPEEFEASADLQASVYRHNLKAQGLDDESIEVLIKKAITDSKLKERADAAFKVIDDAQKRQLTDTTLKAEEADKAANNAINSFLGKVDSAIDSNLKFIIPDAEKPVFRKFVVDNLRYDEGTGSFSVVQKVPDDQLNIVLESLFFQHKKGNLKSLVEKQAKTIASQSLRLKLKSVNGGPGSGQSGAKSEDNFVPLGSLKVTQQ